jgi:hypothetical protein
VKPLVLIYWLRLVLGVVSASISTVLTLLYDEGTWQTFMNGLTVALVVYLVTYYLLKAKFANKLEKKSKIMSQGIGIYFFTWLVFWVLFFSILKGPPVIPAV